MTAPVRLQLKRTKGFNLQALSLSTNGLPAEIVARPRKFGNPFTAVKAREIGYVRRHDTVEDAQTFLAGCFREWLADNSVKMWWQGEESEKRRAAIITNLLTLRGKNLACWCRPGMPCHADVLLELANAPTCEEVMP